MIPKLIHYCWLSDDPLPNNILGYIESWKRFLPDYEIVKWDFSRFDKSSSKWVSEAFDRKKYAFAADYIRLYAIYHYGGIYLDSDVEVLKSFNPFLNLKTMIGWQWGKHGLEIATFGAEKGQKWVKQCLEYYEGKAFVNSDGSFNMQTLPLIIEETLKANDYNLVDVVRVDEALTVSNDNSIPVFSADFFSPKTFDGRLLLNNNTVSIHHFVASWTSPTHRFLRKMALEIGGYRLKSFVSGVKKMLGL